ncbi:MAG: hypothetical protein RLZZ451_2778 [Pseudomonadota bacterium]|jgi:hypothetical protein
MASYTKVKAAVIDVVDDFTKKDVVANYKPAGAATFSAKTKLATLAINETILASMAIRFNKSLSKVVGSGWTEVGAFDLVQKSTIGDLILLACAASGTKVPAGEPA